jgi:glucosylceramidase
MPTVNAHRRGSSALRLSLTFLTASAFALPTFVSADELPIETLPPITHLTRYLTARDTTDRLKEVPITDVISSTSPKDLKTVNVDPKVKYQQIEGFGGAFTDSAGYVLNKLPADKRDEILRAYFDPEKGFGYTLCRTHINSCDFSVENYAYDETPGDTDLKNFSIDRDKVNLIPMIKRAQEISHNGFKLFASPWSPPAWMKTNNDMEHGGKLKPEDRDAWANYYVRYIQEYAKLGIPIWGITVQNEPAAVQTWASCIYSGEEERDFVRDHLGPTIEKSGLGTKIMVWDHNRDIMYDRAKAVLDDPDAAKYVWGVAMHWYVADLFENVQLVHDTWPDKHILLTEACQEGGPHVGEWAPAERYGHSMFEDLNHWSVGWVDWNMVLDQQGGPNNVGNFAASPVIANTDTGEVTYCPSFYYIGHIAKFVRPGAYRILSATSSDDLESVAFANPDGSIVCAVMNRTEIPHRFELRIGGHAAQMDAPQRSIQTVVVNP